jgi:hypothetical protein
MIKISNLNFQNQTIETIEVNGECIENLEIKLTKTKFNIVIVKDGKSIKKEIKKRIILLIYLLKKLNSFKQLKLLLKTLRKLLLKTLRK